jgi:CubicO group peptidase (beta-lactamase class C family)
MSYFFSGGAGISATAMDYTRFMQMLLNGGELNGQRLLGRKTIDLITTNQIGELRIWGGAEFGLGFALVTDNQKHLTLNSVGNYSWGGYFSTSYWMDPEEELTATLMTQMAPTTHGEVHDKFHVLVYQAIID